MRQSLYHKYSSQWCSIDGHRESGRVQLPYDISVSFHECRLDHLDSETLKMKRNTRKQLSVTTTPNYSNQNDVRYQKTNANILTR
jgi:hypothetical protein